MGLYPPLIAKSLRVNPLKRGFGTYALEGYWKRGSFPPALADIVMWYDANTIPNLEGGADVTTWPDDSGQANHMIGSGNDPILRTTAQNGLSAVDFENSGNDWMQVGTPSVGGAQNNMTIMSVMAFEANAVSDIVFLLNSETDYSIIRHDTANADRLVWSPADVGVSACQVYLPIPNTDFHIWYFDYRNAATDAANIAIDGGEKTSDTSTGTVFGDVLNGDLGGQNAGTTADILLGEFIMWKKVLSAEELALAWTYFNNRWNIY